MNRKNLLWIGVVAALAACNPFSDTKGGTPTVLGVLATGGVADDGATTVAEAPAPAGEVSAANPWIVEATTACAANETVANEFVVFVKANKLLDGSKIEQTPNTCVPAGISDLATEDSGWFTVTPFTGGTPDTANVAVETRSWYSCYYPSSATATEGASVVFYRSGPRDFGVTPADIPGDLASTGSSWFDLGAAIPTVVDDRATYQIDGDALDKGGVAMSIHAQLRLIPDGGDAGLTVASVGLEAAHSLTLDWTVGDCTDAAPTYTVEQEQTDGTWLPVPGAENQTASGSVVVATGITYGESYSFRLRETIVGAVTGETFVKTKATVTQTVLETPAAPTFGTVTANSIVVDWAAVPGAASYKVQRAVVGGSFVTAATVADPTVTFTQTGLDPSTVYRFRIVAQNANGASLAGPEAQTTTLAP